MVLTNDLTKTYILVKCSLKKRIIIISFKVNKNKIYTTPGFTLSFEAFGFE